MSGWALDDRVIGGRTMRLGSIAVYRFVGRSEAARIGGRLVDMGAMMSRYWSDIHRLFESGRTWNRKRRRKPAIASSIIMLIIIVRWVPPYGYDASAKHINETCITGHAASHEAQSCEAADSRHFSRLPGLRPAGMRRYELKHMASNVVNCDTEPKQPVACVRLAAGDSRG